MPTSPLFLLLEIRCAFDNKSCLHTFPGIFENGDFLLRFRKQGVHT